MPRKVPLKATPAQEKEKYRKEKEHKLAERERRAAACEAEARAVRPRLRVGPGGTGRPFGTTGGYLKVWMKRIIGNFYTDTDLVRDFILLTPKERIHFIVEFDPKNLGQGSPEEVAARIKAVLDAINETVPASEGNGEKP